MSLYDMNTKEFVFAYHKECVSQYYIHLYLYMVFLKKISLVLTIRFGLAGPCFAWY